MTNFNALEFTLRQRLNHGLEFILNYTYSGAATATHTLISGKLNEFTSLFVCDTDTPPCRTDQWRFETEPPAGPSRFGFFHGALDARKNELSCGAAFSGCGLMDLAVKVARLQSHGKLQQIGLQKVEPHFQGR
jgi:hypothetical protein